MIACDSPAFSVADTPRKTRDARFSEYDYLCARGARKFWRRGLDLEDLKQVAAIGLIKACDRYDHALETPFEAYSWLFIVGELMHYVRDYERLVRTPRSLRSLEHRFLAAQESLLLLLQREPTTSELAAEMKVAVEMVDDLQRSRRSATPLSLDSPDCSPALRKAADPQSDSYLERILLESSLATLSTHERLMVLGVYAEGLTQSEIAQAIGCSPRQASRLHHRAIEKMQRVLVQ